MAHLTRSTDERVVAGVLGGIAQYYGWPASRLRIAYVMVSILSAGFPGTLFYLFLWFIIPENSRVA